MWGVITVHVQLRLGGGGDGGGELARVESLKYYETRNGMSEI